MNIEHIIELMQTDLPEPVDPATSKCGIFVKSATIGLPIKFLPKVTMIPYLWTKLLFASNISLNATALTDSFGISIPIVLFPGIGAWIRTSFAAKANAISLLIDKILLTLVPAGTTISYCVTAGPICISTTFADNTVGRKM